MDQLMEKLLHYHRFHLIEHTFNPDQLLINNLFSVGFLPLILVFIGDNQQHLILIGLKLMKNKLFDN